MKNVMGGVVDPCAAYPGRADLCRFNVCMSGWDYSRRIDAENSKKIDACCLLSGYC